MGQRANPHLAQIRRIGKATLDGASNRCAEVFALAALPAQGASTTQACLFRPILPEILSRSFRGILSVSFQSRPNDAVECFGIAQIIFLREIKLLRLFRPISAIMSGMKNGALLLRNR